MRIALDAMGGDFAPRETVLGALQAAEARPDHEFLLVGDSPRLEAEFRAAGQRKHVVAAGDTLSSIAKKYYNSDAKANIDRIYAANKAAIGSDPDNIKAGMELVIPPAR